MLYSAQTEHDLITLIRDVPDADGWIQWTGGECPVDPESEVEIRLRDGDVNKGKAGVWFWLHDMCHADRNIIAYRLAQQAGESEFAESPAPTAPAILEAAAGHMRDRAATYDNPEGERSMARAVQAFNAIAGKNLTTAEGWLFMAVLKQVRAFQNPGKPHRDSLEDLTAYAALLAEEMLGGTGNARP